jgi:nucleotide-binding universal stress UspA family protein
MASTIQRGGQAMFSIKTVLHPTDFSDCSSAAFQVACSLARDQGARLVLLHVVPRPTPSPRAPDAGTGCEFDFVGQELRDYREEMRERLERFRAPYLPGHVTRVLKEGEPAAEIVRTAQETGCDLIVMGTHGWGGEARRLLGGVAEEVTRQAPCPVLTLRGPLPQPEPVAAAVGEEMDVIL